MAHTKTLDELQPGAATALTIGMFDGVHRGHQALVEQVVQRGRALGGQSAAITFHPHPRAVLAPGAPVSLLTSLDDRLALLSNLGLDVVITLPFTLELSRLSPEAFLDLLQAHLNVKELWVGPDFALGHKRAGTVTRLRELSADRSFTVHTIVEMSIGGEKISSSRVRELLLAGDIEAATLQLGRFPSLAGVITPGARRGRTLGFPTANLALNANYLLPANGIYAVYAELDGAFLPAVANIGTRPTFEDGERLVEVYILDFDGDIYGRQMRVHLVQRLRAELRFASVSELVARMHEDVAEAQAVFARQARA